MLEKNKYEIVSDILLRKSVSGEHSSILDVGCRDCVLRTYIPDGAQYTGVDLMQNDEGTVDHVQDLTAGLPFTDQAYTFVTALDVVEHVDDMHAALQELWRVTGSHLVVVLPNLAFIAFRISFFFRGNIGTTKYDMPYPGNLDRHRWLTTQIQSDAYMRAFAEESGAQLEVLHTAESSGRARLAKICRMLGVSPNVWSWASIYVLTRQSAR